MDFEDAFFNTKDYELSDQTLGKGAFGTVYIVKNIKDRQQYAAKIINTDLEFDGYEQMLFLRESLLLHKLNHPSIVKFKGINFKSFNNPLKLKPTIITEFIPNGSLKDNLDKEKKSLSDLNWNATKKYITLLGISDAMRYLHKQGIIHRDLKPENILMDAKYYPRVCDFGLSRCFSKALTNSMKLTMSGQLGTPLYMAPEILRGENKFGPSVDVYAFSILAYEIVTGKVPFFELRQISPYVLANKVMAGYRPKFTDNVPKKMQKLIKKCWSDDPQNRPSFDEIFETLSNDFTYSDEEVDEEEVLEYISMLEDERDGNSKDNFSSTSQIQKELDQIKEKCAILEREHDILESSNEDFISGLNGIHDKEKNMKRSMSLLRRASEKGNRYASYLLGILYENEGNDFPKSFMYFERSALQGNARSYNRIGYNYLHGTGVLKDYSKAIEYFQKAADLGSAMAINNLGYLNEEGKGVDKNYFKAMKYYQKAADLGSAMAINNLGRFYEEGKGVDKDYFKAMEYYQKAADLGSASAINNLGIFYEEGKGVDKNYSKAKEYYQKAADLGSANAINNLGHFYEKGKGVHKDYFTAKEYYLEAADLGDSHATYKLGRFYEKGKGVDKIYSKAMEYYQKAAYLGSSKAMYNLGRFYEEGIRVDQDYSKAMEYYLKAADLGDSHALNNLGRFYTKGTGVDQDYSKAIRYYQKAADLGNSHAMNNLGIFYAKGTGVVKDHSKAIRYFQKAADLGNANAIDNLRKLKKE